MSDIICVTNRRLCGEDFLLRMDRIARAHPAAVILREKDLTKESYRQLAKQVMQICGSYQVPCILHNFVDTAMELNAEAVHLPLPVLRSLDEDQRHLFRVLGTSCHSVEDAKEAQALGCTYLSAGHIFATDCKKGLPGRGLDFLREVCRSVSIPVYAIGGISSDTIASVRAVGASGACVMSGLMQCGNVQEYLEAFDDPEVCVGRQSKNKEGETYAV